MLHLLRHGQTEMNAYLEKHEYGSDGFVDPLLCALHLAISAYMLPLLGPHHGSCTQSCSCWEPAQDHGLPTQV